jgi:MFS family permease
MSLAFSFAQTGAMQLALIAMGALVMTGAIGPVTAVVVDVVDPELRSTAASMLALSQNLFGLAAGPLLTGFLSDVYGLPFALSAIPIFCVLAASLFIVAARTYEGDLQRVTSNANPEATLPASRP